MTIEPFTKKHLSLAQNLLMENYMEERESACFLPKLSDAPKLDELLESPYGVVAIEKKKLLGYLACYKPWEEFNCTHEKGTFIPLHGHAAVKEDRERIYQKMYAVMADKLMEDKVRYHGIAMFTHDADGMEAFYNLGFGKRCMAQIRSADIIGPNKTTEFEFSELPLNQFPEIRDMRKDLNEYLKKSPAFKVSLDEDFEKLISTFESGDTRTFVAKKCGEIVAYIDLKKQGQNFITWQGHMQNIQGAWCKEEYRGSGMYDDLLNYVITTVKNEGSDLISVEHETFNATAMNYWRKHFTSYATTLVRRIDECYK